MSFFFFLGEMPAVEELDSGVKLDWCNTVCNFLAGENDFVVVIQC